MREVDWNLTVGFIYPNGFMEEIKLHPPNYRIYGRKLGGKRPIILSVPKAQYDKLDENFHIVMDPRVSRDNILTHTADGPDMDRINKIVFPDDKQLY